MLLCVFSFRLCSCFLLYSMQSRVCCVCLVSYKHKISELLKPLSKIIWGCQLINGIITVLGRSVREYCPQHVKTSQARSLLSFGQYFPVQTSPNSYYSVIINWLWRHPVNTGIWSVLIGLKSLPTGQYFPVLPG